MKKIFLPAIFAMILTGCSDSPEDFVVPEEGPIEMSWDGLTVKVEDGSDWCLSRSNSWIAMTNYANKTQYYLQWEGGMESGDKTEVVFKIALDGAAPQEYEISSCSLSHDGINCSITFSSNTGEKGCFTFLL